MVRSVLCSLLSLFVAVAAGCSSSPPPPTAEEVKANVAAHAQRSSQEAEKYKNSKPKGHGR